MRNQVLIPFVSAKGGLGRTHAVLETAKLLAQAGRRTLVVDLDITAPTVGYLAADDAGRRPGVADFLRTTVVRRYPRDFGDFVHYSNVYGCEFVPLGEGNTLPLLAIGRSKIDHLVGELRSGPWEFVLMDMPAGMVTLNSPGYRSLLERHAGVICTFVHPGHEHRAFADHLTDSLIAARESVPVLWVNSMVPPGEEQDIWRTGYDTEYSTSLTRLSALQHPGSQGWRDPKFLVEYRRLAEKVLDLARYQQQTQFVLRQSYDVAIHALKTGQRLQPTILGRKLDAFLHPRVLVVAGRHGAGKTALMSAVTAHKREVTVPPLDTIIRMRAAGRSWHQVWLDWWHNSRTSQLDTTESRVVFDGLDAEIAHRLGWSEAIEGVGELIQFATLLRLTQSLLDVKLLLLPGALYAHRDLVSPRQYRSLLWTEAELLEMALRRATEISPAFSEALEVRHQIRLSPKDEFRQGDWSRRELDAAARVLFGPDGLEGWERALGRETSVASELVPEEAAELLILALEMARESSLVHGAFIPPHLLEAAVSEYATRRVKHLLRLLRLPWGSVQLLAQGNTPMQLSATDSLQVEMLNAGLLRWREGDTTLEVPPLIRRGLDSDGKYPET